MPKASRYLSGPRIEPRPLARGCDVVRLVEETFQAYNAGRIHDACRLFAERMLKQDVTVGMSLTGALTPAGVGRSCIVPLVQAGFVDWIVSTGANLYHDAHYALDLALHRGSPFLDDTALRRDGVVRIYDILFDYNVLLETDAFFRRILEGPEFQREMSTAEFHALVGKYLKEREKALGLNTPCVLTAAYDADVPIFTSSPGDSSIGMNVAAMALVGSAFRFDVSADVNLTAAIVWDAKRRGGKSAVFIVGGGSPKNFMLQTEPQIQEVLGLPEKGHDYFLQITDARPDTGGLSGATPSEAVSWGKVDPSQLPDTVVAYVDSTVALPIVTAYALSKARTRKLKRLAKSLPALREELGAAYSARLRGARPRKAARKESV
jgi:deoxyhypusine synthase